MKTNTSQPLLKPKLKSHGGNIFDWHEDCLVLTVLLASALSGKEMKKILIKSGYGELPGADSPHGALLALHSACHQDKLVIAQVNKTLNACFGNTVTKAKKMTKAQLCDLASKRALLAPFIWACYQHPDLSMRGLGRELAHAAIWRGLSKSDNPDQLEQVQAKAKKLSTQTAELNKQVAGLKKENLSLQFRLNRKPGSQPAELDRLRQQHVQERKEIRLLRRQMTELKKLQQDQAEELAVWRSLALSSESQSDEGCARAAYCREGCRSGAPESCDECQNGPACAESWDQLLDGQKVAVIGGLERLEPQYRDLIEKMGGSCLFSPGHTKNGGREFRTIVQKSDLVICITAINSHGAMKVVKKHCKLCRKPFCPLKGTSVGSLKNLLNDYVKQNGVTSMISFTN